jgi:hypothetical protein
LFRKKRKIEEELIKEREEQLTSILEFDRKFKTQQEEIEALRISLDSLRTKYREVCFELAEFQKEAEVSRESLLNTIREGQREISFYEEISKKLFNPGEMLQIRMQSFWSEEKESFIIAPFLFKNKTLRFPKLNQLEGHQVIEKEKKERTLYVEEKENNKEKVFSLLDKENMTNKNKKMLPDLKNNCEKENSIKPMREQYEIIKRPKRRIINLEEKGIDSPSLAQRTKKKKEYLFALDKSNFLFQIII